MLVDAHTHVVAADREAFPLSTAALPGDWYIRAPCSAECLMAEMDTAGVDLAVLVQPVGAYSFDNRYAATGAEAHPGRFTAACCVDPYGESPAGSCSAGWITPASAVCGSSHCRRSGPG